MVGAKAWKVCPRTSSSLGAESGLGGFRSAPSIYEVLIGSAHWHECGRSVRKWAQATKQLLHSSSEPDISGYLRPDRQCWLGPEDAWATSPGCVHDWIINDIPLPSFDFSLHCFSLKAYELHQCRPAGLPNSALMTSVSLHEFKCTFTNHMTSTYSRELFCARKVLWLGVHSFRNIYSA